MRMPQALAVCAALLAGCQLIAPLPDIGGAGGAGGAGGGGGEGSDPLSEGGTLANPLNGTSTGGGGGGSGGGGGGGNDNGNGHGNRH